MQLRYGFESHKIAKTYFINFTDDIKYLLKNKTVHNEEKFK